MRGPEVGPSDPEDGVGLAGSSSAASVGADLNMFSKSELVTDSPVSRVRRRGAGGSPAPAMDEAVGTIGVDDMLDAAAGMGTGTAAGAGAGVEDAAAPVEVGRARGGVFPRLAGVLPLALVTGAGADGGGGGAMGATGAEVGVGGGVEVGATLTGATGAPVSTTSPSLRAKWCWYKSTIVDRWAMWWYRLSTSTVSRELLVWTFFDKAPASTPR